MWMGLQGERTATAGDFLKLFEDSSPVDSKPPAQGFFLRTRDFLQPLERPEASGGGGLRGAQRPPAAVDIDVSAAPGAAGKSPTSAEHVPPRCFGAYGHVRPAAVKPDWPTCAPAPSAEGEAAGSRRFAVAFDGDGHGGGRSRSCDRAGAFSPWEGPALGAASGVVIAGKGQQQQWPPPPFPFSAARGGINGSFPRSRPAQNSRRPIVAASMSNKGFADEEEEEDEEEEDSKKKENPYKREMTVKVDRCNGNDSDNIDNEHIPSSPRSKHSATEQRRRTKINDRFQILRDLIPHSDQKRDKASFLLEVVEYIQFLQAKVQKYRSLYPGWNQDNAKLMPWKNCQAPGVGVVDHSHIMKECPASTGLIYCAGSSSLRAPTIMSNNENVAESEKVLAGLASKPASMSIPMQCPTFEAGNRSSQPHKKFISDSESMAAQPQTQWLRSPTMDTSGDADMLSEQQELAVDEGTLSLSSLHSKRLLRTLTDALQSSGVDLSRASISVQINLSRRTTSRPPSSHKETGLVVTKGNSSFQNKGKGGLHDNNVDPYLGCIPSSPLPPD